MSDDSTLLTPEGMESLRGELKHLLEEEKPDLIRRLAEARAHGDLSENAEYHAVKERKAHVERRIHELGNVVATAEVFSPDAKTAGGKCVFGSSVKVKIRNGEKKAVKREFKIVGALEADSGAGKLSLASPLGKNLLGKTSGDSFEVEAPAGTIQYEIVSVSYD